jgi:hypothetical protein
LCFPSHASTVATANNRTVLDLFVQNVPDS